MPAKLVGAPRDKSTVAVLQFFEFDHLPGNLQHVSEPFHALAYYMADHLQGPELTVGLRKLLESKDCMVRAALPLRTEWSAPRYR